MSIMYLFHPGTRCHLVISPSLRAVFLQQSSNETFQAETHEERERGGLFSDPVKHFVATHIFGISKGRFACQNERVFKEQL